MSLQPSEKGRYWQIRTKDCEDSAGRSPSKSFDTALNTIICKRSLNKKKTSSLNNTTESLSKLTTLVSIANNIDDVRCVFDRLCSLARIRYLSITRYANGEIYSEDRLRFSNFPEGWHKFVEANGHAKNSALARKLAESMTPLAWSEVYADRQLHQAVLDRASSFGADMNGFSIALRSSRGACTTVFCNFNCSSSEFTGIMQDFVPQLVVLGQSIAERLDDILVPYAKQSPKLSARELECLKAAAEGSMIKQTAQKLRIAPQTVGFHLNMARTQLKARNTTHAVAIAIAKKLIFLN